MRFPKMVFKSILHKQMAEELAVEVSCSYGNRTDRHIGWTTVFYDTDILI